MDEALFEVAWNQHSRALVRYCTYSTGSCADGEDITAEVFSRLLSTNREIRPAKLEAWLFTVARNLCVSHHRAASRRRLLVDRLSDGSQDTASDAWGDPELWEHVRKLDEKARLVIYLRVLQGRPFSEVGEVVGVREGAAKMIHYRAMKRLRESLRSDDIEFAKSYAGGVRNAD